MGRGVTSVIYNVYIMFLSVYMQSYYRGYQRSQATDLSLRLNLLCETGVKMMLLVNLPKPFNLIRIYSHYVFPLDSFIKYFCLLYPYLR